MSSRALAEALREVADRAPRLDVAQAAVSLAERRRRRRLVVVPVATAVAVLCLVLASAVVLPTGSVQTPGAPPSAVVLPDRVARPVGWTPRVTESVSGPAAYVVPSATAGEPAVIGVDGSARLLPNPVASYGGGVAAALSPDGQHLAYAPDSSAAGSSGEHGSAEPLRIVDLRTGNVRSIDLTAQGFEPYAEGLTWSPQGDRLAMTVATVFSSSSSGGTEASSGGLDLVTLDVSTLSLRRTAAGLGTVAWSPSGDRLARITMEEEGSAFVEVLDSRTGRELDRVAVPDGADIDAGAWSPDGRELALTRRVGPVLATDVNPGSADSSPPPPWELVRVPLDGGATTSVPIGEHGNPWVAGWRGATPVLQVADGASRTLLQSVDLATGTRTTVVTLPTVGVAQVEVARDLLSSAPLAEVETQQAPWWSLRAARWWFENLTAAAVLGSAALLLFFGLVARGLVRRGRRALGERAERRI
jgi:dipeptidyl aminopeptidase/acylaminoacyl peptidase